MSQRDMYIRNAPLSAYTWSDQPPPRQPTYTIRAKTNHRRVEPYNYGQPKPGRWLFLFFGILIGAVAATGAMLAVGHQTHHVTSVAAVQADGNTQVCQHYKTQRAWLKGLAKPTLTDALKFETWIAADEAESTGTLHNQFAALSSDEQHQKSSYADSMKVYGTCEALGVNF